MNAFSFLFFKFIINTAWICFDFILLSWTLMWSNFSWIYNFFIVIRLMLKLKKSLSRSYSKCRCIKRFIHYHAKKTKCYLFYCTIKILIKENKWIDLTKSLLSINLDLNKKVKINQCCYKKFTNLFEFRKIIKWVTTTMELNKECLKRFLITRTHKISRNNTEINNKSQMKIKATNKDKVLMTKNKMMKIKRTSKVFIQSINKIDMMLFKNKI